MTWTAAERRAWTPPRSVGIAQWAEENRTLSAAESSIAGPWRNAYAPHLRGFLELLESPRVEKVVVRKAAQVAFSEGIRCAIGYWADREPEPVLLVLPDEHTGAKIMQERIIPLIRSTPCLAELYRADGRTESRRRVELSNGFRLRIGWSGSPATLASDNYCRVVCDEVDKFPPWSGREADPISLAEMRTMTYIQGGRRRIVIVSTPTTRAGVVWQEWEACPIHLWYYVPCPNCGEFQVLSDARLRYEHSGASTDAGRIASELQDTGAVWYECESCSTRILERQRNKMCNAGVWAVSAEAAAASPGRAVSYELWPRSRAVGMQINTLYSLFVPWAYTAAEMIASRGNAAAMQNYRNSWMGEAFEQQVVSQPARVFRDIQSASAAPRNTVPQWARKLLLTVDVQKAHMWYVLRAWGARYRSQRVNHGMIESWPELASLMEQRFQIAGGEDRVPIDRVGVDSGYRTEEVYRFSLEHAPIVRAFKGLEAVLGRPIRVKRITYRPPDAPASALDVWLHEIDVAQFKDRLASKIGQGEGVWALNDDADEQYARQMSAEHKVMVRSRGKQIERWVRASAGAPNHYWDCEVLQLALAETERVDLLDDGPVTQPLKWSERIRRR